MRRREFITLIGGAAAGWPLAGRAQQRKQMRRVGALMPWTASDPQVQARYAAFLQGLQQLGWTVGTNVEIDSRWSAGNEGETRRHAAELVALHRTSSSRVAAGQWGHCCGQPAPCRLCSRTRPIRSAPDMSKAWRGRAAISRALRHLNTALAQNGWSCSSRLCQA